MVAVDQFAAAPSLPPDVADAAFGTYKIYQNEQRRAVQDEQPRAILDPDVSPAQAKQLAEMLNEIDGQVGLAQELSDSMQDFLVLTAEDGGYNFQKWFQTPPLTPTGIEKLHSLQLITESHDQGYCDAPENGNWTWFELVILENENATSPRIKDGIELTWISHVNRFCTKEYGWKEGQVFRKNHDIFRLLEDGNVVAVRLCVRFLGWELHAKSAYLMVEVGETIIRTSPNYGGIASRTQSMQQAFNEINTALMPETVHLATVSQEVFTAQMLTGSEKRPLRVLSLDGGGVRGMAALVLLDEVMKKIAPNKQPYEVFDMIGGTSTGGFIALMLGRFKMTIQQCKDRYKDFMGDVFPEHYKLTKDFRILTTGSIYEANVLEGVIKKLVKERLGDENVLLFDKDAKDDSCKVFMVATRQDGANNSAPVLFRTYTNPIELSEFPKIKLWEAARATSAAPTYFAPLTITDEKTKLKTTFLDGGLQANNPLGWLWNEVLSVYGPDRSIECFLSIGTGIPKAVKGANNIISTASTVASIATNSEVTNILFRSLLNAFAPKSMARKYWRLNVGDGMPDWVVGDDGKMRWRLIGQRDEKDIGDMDNVAAIDQTVKRAEDYIRSGDGAKLLSEISSSLGTLSV